MKADGLYDLRGRPASYDKRRAIDEREESLNNNEDSNGVNMTNDVYRYDQTQKVKEDSINSFLQATMPARRRKITNQCLRYIEFNFRYDHGVPC